MERSFFEENTKDSGFFQSDLWKSFQAACGREVVHFEGEKTWGNGIIHTLPLIGKYLYFPRGPVFGDEKAVRNTWEAFLTLAQEKNTRFIRIEPQNESVYQALLHVAGEKKVRIVEAPHAVQPKEVFMIDLSQSEEEMLKRMKQKTRYNIRLAEKKGVQVVMSREKQYQVAFIDLIVRTADRKVIAPHPRAYYEQFFRSFPEENLFLFSAVYEGKVIASNMLCLYGTTAFYLHGGSGDEHREVMAPYLLQWEQIKFAKAHGALRYDFGGVKSDEEDQKKSSWAGITRFKFGFDTAEKPTVFPGTFDIILDAPRYSLYRFLQRMSYSLHSIKRSLF